MTWSDLSTAAKATIILAVLGFFVSFEMASRTSRGGVTTCSYIDYGATGLGALAALAGLTAAVAALRAGKTLPGVAGGLAALVGAWQVASGLGLIGGPCN